MTREEVVALFERREAAWRTVTRRHSPPTMPRMAS